MARQLTPAIVLSIKIDAFIIAAAPPYVLIYHYGFEGPLWEWGLIVLGILAYIVAKAMLAILLGYLWGRQDAKDLSQMADLPLGVKQDIIDNAPSDVKDRVANILKDKSHD